MGGARSQFLGDHTPVVAFPLAVEVDTIVNGTTVVLTLVFVTVVASTSVSVDAFAVCVFVTFCTFVLVTFLVSVLVAVTVSVAVETVVNVYNVSVRSIYTRKELLQTTGINFVLVLMETSVSVDVVVRVFVLLASMTCGLAAALPARMSATRA
jgi:hypothetical protein